MSGVSVGSRAREKSASSPFSGRFTSKTCFSAPSLDSHSSTQTATSSSRAFLRSFAIG